MYRKIKDFLENWEYESEATLRIFRNLTDESLDQRVSAEGRSLRDLAWHITETLGEMPGHAGIAVEAPDKSENAPQYVRELVDAYRNAAESLKSALADQWTDDDLPVEIMMYGEKWRKGDLLSALIMHQAHHRAQMTVLMRQAGLKVPGIYGPSREEWEQFKTTETE